MKILMGILGGWKIKAGLAVVVLFLGWLAWRWFDSRVIVPIKNYDNVVWALDSTQTAAKETLQANNKAMVDTLVVLKKKRAEIEDLRGDLGIAKGQIAELQHNYNKCGKDYRVIIKGLKDDNQNLKDSCGCDCDKRKKFLGIF